MAVLEPSSLRVKPPVHPGLDYGFVSYEGQLGLKRQVIKDALERALKRNINIPQLRPAPSAWHYRSAVQPVVTPNGLGYRAPNSHKAVSLSEDPVANSALNTFWGRWSGAAPKSVRELALRGNEAGEVLVCFIATTSARNLLSFAHGLLKETNAVGVSYARHDSRGRFRRGSERLAGERSIRQRYGSFEVTVNATSFAQPNPLAAGLLYKRLVELAPGGQHAFELYAGGGVIGMHLLEKYDRVTALEIDKGSVTRGRRDAARLGLDVVFVHSDAKRVDIPADADLVVVDPPRSGLAKDLRELIDRSSSTALLYVSCDVVTWARDVAAFEKLGWTLETFEPFDFYPQTHHIELLSKLSR